MTHQITVSPTAVMPDKLAPGEPNKILYLGHSGTGKTGSIGALLHIGYNVRFIDADNGTQILTGSNGLLLGPKSVYKPESIKRLSVIKVTEKMRVAGGKIVPATGNAWNKAIGLLEKYKGFDEVTKTEIDLGSIQTWSENDVLVLDSLTFLGKFALNAHRAMNGRLAGSTGNEYRRDVWAAQDMIESMLELLYDTSIKCNVIICAHIAYSDDPEAPPPLPNENKKQMGLPSTLGKALSPKAPRFFNAMLMAKMEGTGPTAIPRIYTKSQGVLMLKNPAPHAVAPYYPLDMGLAEYFKVVRGS